MNYSFYFYYSQMAALKIFCLTLLNKKKVKKKSEKNLKILYYSVKVLQIFWLKTEFSFKEADGPFHIIAVFHMEQDFSWLLLSNI